MNRRLHKRILDISYKHKLSHIGSNLVCVDTIDEIYRNKTDAEPFILSSGHAGLALYVVLESRFGIDAEKLLEKHGVHPSKDLDNKIWCTTGSLGQGITVAVGRALSNRKRNVWCIISDGESAEGSVYESLRFAGEDRLYNLKVFMIYNGFGAYKTTDEKVYNLSAYFPVDIRYKNIKLFGLPFLKGLDAHYYTMNDNDYKFVQEQFK